MMPRLMLAASCVAAAAPVAAQDMQHMAHMAHGAHASAPAPAAFVASSDKSLAQLMDDAMAIMDRDMRAAKMNREAGHDFVTMMLPHHQGAIDMAKAVLLSTRDPELRNLALGIITEQQNEINVMRAWLARHPDTRSHHKEKP